MTYDVLKPQPQRDVIAISQPAWYREFARGRNGSVHQFLHPDHGWLTFQITPEGASRLGAGLLKQSALCDYFARLVPPSTITVNRKGTRGRQAC